MKTLILLLIITILGSCSMTDPDLAQAVKPCTLGYMQDLPNGNVKFIKTVDIDTIRCQFITAEGSLAKVTWIDGKIDWNCLPFNRYSFDYEIKIWTRDEECIFIIKASNL